MAARPLLFALILLGISLTISEAFIPGGKCPTTEYAAALGSCLADYLKGLSWAVGGYGLGKRVAKPYEAIRDYNKKACEQSGLIDRTITCIEQVSEMCDYTFVSIDLVRVLSANFCYQVDAILDFTKCRISSNDVFDFFNTADKIDTADPVCSAAKALQGLGIFLGKQCTPGPAGIFASIGSLIADNNFCSQYKPGETSKCSLMAYYLTAQTCTMSLLPKIYADLLAVYQKHESYPIAETIEAVCGWLPEESLDCIEKVNMYCGMSMFNVGKARKAFTSMCASKTEVSGIDKCFDVDIDKHIPCFMDAINTKTGVCAVLAEAKACLQAMSHTCGSNAQTVLDNFYDLVVPSVCDTPTDKTFSLLSYTTSLGVCWMPSLTWMASQYNPNITVKNEKTCDVDVLNREQSCQKSLDTMYEGSFMDSERLLAMIKTVCGTKVIRVGGMCSSGQTLVYGLFRECPIMNLTANPVENQDDLCELVRKIRACSADEYTVGKEYDNCDDEVSLFSRTVTAKLVPAQCGIVTVRTKSSPDRSRGNSLCIQASLSFTALLLMVTWLVLW